MNLFSQPPKPFRVFDVIYLALAFPLIFAVFHDAVLCQLAPAFGFHAADDPWACTLGWYVFYLIPVFFAWAVATLAAFFRVHGLIKLGGTGRIMLMLHAVAILVPLGAVLYVFFLAS